MTQQTKTSSLMKQIHSYLLVLCLIVCCSCTKQELDTSDPVLVFDEFWTWVDQNYIYFDDKGVSWEEVYDKYRSSISASTTDDELFDVLEAALTELKDGHNRLESTSRRAQPYDFKQGFEIHFSPALVQQQYIRTNLGSQGNLSWSLLQDSIGYIYLPDFTRYGAFRSVLELMDSLQVPKVIIDVRSNGGGDSNPIPELLGVLVSENTLLGSYIEKSGPEHTDVTNPVGITAVPSEDFHFDSPIVVLTNRGSYSATSYFAAMMQGLPNVTIMGQVTGGGGGGNLGYQLSNGWLVAVSVSDFLDKQGKSIESGVIPDIAVSNSATDIEAGVDRMLEMAIGL